MDLLFEQESFSGLDLNEATQNDRRA